MRKMRQFYLKAHNAYIQNLQFNTNKQEIQKWWWQVQGSYWEGWKKTWNRSQEPYKMAISKELDTLIL